MAVQVYCGTEKYKNWYRKLNVAAKDIKNVIVLEFPESSKKVLDPIGIITETDLVPWDVLSENKLTNLFGLKSPLRDVILSCFYHNDYDQLDVDNAKLVAVLPNASNKELDQILAQHKTILEKTIFRNALKQSEVEVAIYCVMEHLQLAETNILALVPADPRTALPQIAVSRGWEITEMLA